VVKEQRAIEKKLPEGVEQAAVEIGEEVLEPGVGETQAKGGEEEEGCYDCAWLSLTALSTVTCNLWL
jgi:hypothetical protein